jgi:membrane protein DedA with SNARE-associated domain
MDQPFAVAFLCLTAVAAVRSQCTYWLGRGVRAGVLRSPWARRLSAEGALKARDKLERWGWPLIPASFLTVGFQTAVNLSAGLIGWRWTRYTLAAVPGWLIWGAVYAAGGLALFAGVGALAAASPWLAVATIQTLVVAAVVAVYLRRRRRLDRRAAAGEAAGAARAA